MILDYVEASKEGNLNKKKGTQQLFPQQGIDNEQNSIEIEILEIVSTEDKEIEINDINQMKKKKISFAEHRLNAIKFLRELLFLTRSLSTDRRFELYSRLLNKLGHCF